jgi:hypothetical protein
VMMSAMVAIWFCSSCFQYVSDWDIAGWPLWKVVVVAVVAFAVMCGGAMLCNGFASVVQSVVGFVLCTGSIAVLLAGFVALTNFDGDMSRVFGLAMMFVVVSGLVWMVLSGLLDHPDTIVWGVCVVAMFLMGMFSDTLLTAWTGSWMDRFGMAASGSMTVFDWVCWAVAGLAVACAMMRGTAADCNVRNAVNGGAEVFVGTVRAPMKFAKSRLG